MLGVAIYLALASATVLCLVALVRPGSDQAISRRPGWSIMVGGTAVALAGAVVALVEAIVIVARDPTGGDRSPWPAGLALFAGGFVAGAIGLSRWLPAVGTDFADDEARARELRRVREQLSTTEARINAFFEYAPIVLGIKGVDGEYLATNQHFADSLGLRVDEVIGRTPRELYPPDLVESIEAHDRALLEAKTVETREIDGTLNGEDRSFISVKFPIERADGTMLGIGAIAVDISRVRMATRELERSESRYRELFENSPVPLFEEDWSDIRRSVGELRESGVTDLRAHLAGDAELVAGLYDSIGRAGASDAAPRLYRVGSPEEVERMLTSRSISNEHLAGFGRAIAALDSGADNYAFEARATAADGTLLTTVIRVVLPDRSRDDWDRVLVSIEDITAQRQAELRLSYTQRLEAIGQLTGGMAHDFNNLLAVVLGSAELLKLSPTVDEHLVDDIITAAHRGSDLTHRLLAYARRQPLSPKSVDLAQLVLRSKEMLVRTIDEIVEIDVETPAGLWRARADEGQVEDALLNLVLNARNAMPDGGRVSIRCANARLTADDLSDEQDLEPGDYVLLEVADTGVGMTADVQERMFEPFFTTREVGQGSGLGLSMVYGLVKQSGGHITVDSDPGLGTTIELFLPRDITSPDDTEAEAAQHPSPVGGGEVVLVIEDQTEVRDTVVRTLHEIGYQTVATRHAAEARTVLEAGAAVDVVLSDVVLPGAVSGPAFAAELSAERPELPVVFMSGYPRDDATGGGQIAPDTPLLTKPFRPGDLAHALDHVLHHP